jgi:RNA polymerase sigma factor (sigma-70 family)
VQTAPDQFDYEAALRACARGERQALRGLYDQEGARLLGVALRIVRERHTAEDVLHDAFVSIWTKAGSFDAGRGSGRGWIYTVVRHLALDVVRRRAHEVSVSGEAMEGIESGTSAQGQIADAFELRANLGRLHDCLTRLDAGQRNSILHAYVDGCSHSEIAERLKSPLGTVKTWIRRGLSALRDCML